MVESGWFCNLNPPPCQAPSEGLRVVEFGLAYADYISAALETSTSGKVTNEWQRPGLPRVISPTHRRERSCSLLIGLKSLLQPGRPTFMGTPRA